MAGCVCEKENELYEDSQKNEAKKLVATGVSADVAQKQAHEIVDHHRSVDNKFKGQDEEGCEGKGAAFTFTSDGDVFFPEYKGYLNGLYQNQKEARPQQYNPEEHETVLSAYQSLRNGATQAAHIVHHYNEQGDLDIRDVVVLTYDRQTNTGQMHILNISREGNSHQSLESARVAMQQRLGGFKEEIKTENIFLFVREEKAIDPVSLFREKSQAPEIHERIVISLNDYGEEPLRKVSIVQPVKEAIPFIRPVFQADKRREDIPFRLPSFLQRLMGRDENGKLIQQEKQTKRKEKNIIMYDNRPREIQNGKFTKETSSVLLHIEKQKEKVDEGKKGIVLARETGIGIGGALFILDSLKEPVTPLTKKEKREIHRVIRRLERIEQSASPRLSMKKERSKRESVHLRLIHPDTAKRVKREMRRVKLLSRREIKKLKNKEKLRIFFPLKERKHATISTETRKKENFSVHAKKMRLLTALEKITRRIRSEDQRLIKKPERKIRLRRKEKQDKQERKYYVRRLVMEFIKTWIIFALLQQFSYEKQSSKSKENVVSGIPFRKEEQSSHESGPWVLLSIIWYLTMIREQGKVVISPKKKKKKKIHAKKKLASLKIKPLPWISRQGLIYAYQTIP
jgi:hypothetical protein